MDDNPYNTSIEWDQDLMPSLEFQSFEYDELENLFDAAFGTETPSEHGTAQSTMGVSPSQIEATSPPYRQLAAASSSTNIRSAPRRSSFSRRQMTEGTGSPHSSDQSLAGNTDNKTSSPRSARRGPSPDAIERRRRQNRASQLAFRERSKKALEEMRTELSTAEERNKKMVVTLNSLLRQTDSLRSSIEHAIIEYGGTGTGANVSA